AAISGLSSRVSVAIVCSTLTSRPFTFLVPNRSGNFWRMSSRIMVSGLLNSFVPARRTRSKNMISSDEGRRAAVGGAAPGAAHAPNRSWHIFYLSRDLQGWRRLLNHRQQGLPVRLEQLGNALLAYVGDDDLPNLSMHVREDTYALHLLCLQLVVFGRGDVVHRASIVSVDQEYLDEGHQSLLAERSESVLVANREDVAAATILDVGEDHVGELFPAGLVQQAQLQQFRTGRVRT